MKLMATFKRKLSIRIICKPLPLMDKIPAIDNRNQNKYAVEFII